MKRYLPAIATILMSLGSAALQLYWAGQDKQGQFQPENLWSGGNLGTSIFYLGPYVLLAMSALFSFGHRASRIGFMIALVLCGIGLTLGWFEHVQFLRTPPGQETIPMLSFLATILSWIGSFVALIIVGVMSLAYDDRTSRATNR
jgi:hypothetical protein